LMQLFRQFSIQALNTWDSAAGPTIHLTHKNPGSISFVDVMHRQIVLPGMSNILLIFLCYHSVVRIMFR
jgi:hypothetical protein